MTIKQIEAEDAKYNRQYTVNAMARFFQQQDSHLLMSEAYAKANHEYEQGTRWDRRLGVTV